jgi:hypothetical protein
VDKTVELWNYNKTDGMYSNHCAMKVAVRIPYANIKKLRTSLSPSVCGFYMIPSKNSDYVTIGWS